jgi:hypothetical protein
MTPGQERDFQLAWDRFTARNHHSFNNETVQVLFRAGYTAHMEICEQQHEGTPSSNDH